MNILQKLLLPSIQLQTVVDNLSTEHKELLLQSLTEYDTEKIESTINYLIDNTTDLQLKLKLRAFDIAIDNSYWHLRELNKYNSHNILSLLIDTESTVIDTVNSVLSKYSINNKEIAKEVYEILFIANMKKDKENNEEAERNLRTLRMLKKRSKNS